MNLKDYSLLLSPLLPLGVNYITMDSGYIKAYIDKPRIIVKGSSRLFWQGTLCVAKIKYWKDFLDISENLDEKNQMDWALCFEKISSLKWSEKIDFAKWINMLDFLLPYPTSFITIKDEKIEFWRGLSCPQLLNDEWIEKGGHIPFATLSAPKELINAPVLACFTYKKGKIEAVT